MVLMTKKFYVCIVLYSYFGKMSKNPYILGATWERLGSDLGATWDRLGINRWQGFDRRNFQLPSFLAFSHQKNWLEKSRSPLKVKFCSKLRKISYI